MRTQTYVAECVLAQQAENDYKCKMKWPPIYACPQARAEICTGQSSDRCVMVSFRAAISTPSCDQEFRRSVCNRLAPRAQAINCDAKCSTPIRRHRRLEGRLQGSSFNSTLVTVYLEGASVSAIEAIEAKIIDVLSSAEAATTFLDVQVTSLPELTPPFRRSQPAPIAVIVGSCAGAAFAVALVVVATLRKPRSRPALRKAALNQRGAGPSGGD